MQGSVNEKIHCKFSFYSHSQFVVVFNCLDVEGKKYLSKEEFERAARNYSDEKNDLDGFVTNIFTKVRPRRNCR